MVGLMPFSGICSTICLRVEASQGGEVDYRLAKRNLPKFTIPIHTAMTTAAHINQLPGMSLPDFLMASHSPLWCTNSTLGAHKERLKFQPFLASPFLTLLRVCLVVIPELRRAEAHLQLFDSLDNLNRVVNDVFGQISARVRTCLDFVLVSRPPSLLPSTNHVADPYLLFYARLEMKRSAWTPLKAESIWLMFVSSFPGLIAWPSFI